MKTLRPILLLFRYQSSLMPWIWVFPLSYAIPGLFPQAKFYYNLEIMSSMLSQMMWVPLMLAAYVFGSGLMMGNKLSGSAGGAQMAYFSSEFILTRAVDKSAVYWSRVLLYWCLTLVPILLWLLVASYSPSFKIEVRPQNLEHYLNAFPHSYVTSDKDTKAILITVPFGNYYKTLGMAAAALIIAMAGQLAVLAIAGLNHRRWWFWGLFAGTMILVGVGTIFKGGLVEDFILATVAYWYLFAPALAVAAVVVLLLGRRMFVNQEQF